MFFSLVNKMGGKNKLPKSFSKEVSPVQDKDRPIQRTAKKRVTADEIQSALDNAIYQLKMGVRGQAPMALFKQLDAKQNGMVTPMDFAKFVNKTVHGMSPLPQTVAPFESSLNSCFRRQDVTWSILSKAKRKLAVCGGWLTEIATASLTFKNSVTF